jgi:hypothetical protein
MEQEKNYEQKQGKDGAYVVPLDELRTLSYQTKVFISGEFPGSAFWPIASGKVAYLKQAMVTAYSGIYPVNLKWADASTALSGNVISGSAAIAHLLISSGNALGGSVLFEFIPALGPYVSGICLVSGGCQIGGVVTGIIQIDPVTTQ